MPEDIIYQYNEKYHQITSISTPIGRPFRVANGEPVYKEEVINMNQISLTTLPSRIFFWVRQAEGERDMYTSDTLARISQISVTVNSRTGILNNTEEWDLWRMSVDNGLKMSFDEWKHYCGSVLCIDFGKNIGLGEDEGVGLEGTYNFSAKVYWSPIDNVPKKYDLNCLVLYEGSYTFVGTKVFSQNGLISRSDVINSEEKREMDSDFVERIYGGSFLSSAKSLLSSIKPYAKKGAKIGRELAPLVSTLAPRAGPAFE